MTEEEDEDDDKEEEEKEGEEGEGEEKQKNAIRCNLYTKLAKSLGLWIQITNVRPSMDQRCEEVCPQREYFCQNLYS